MEIGSGIAIAGVWIFAGLVLSSAKLNNWGMWVSIICAVVVTAVLV